MTNERYEPIIAGIGLGGIRLYDVLDLGSWSSALGVPMLWEFGWVGADFPAYINLDGSVIAFVDGKNRVLCLYATPRYSGSIFGSIRTGMTAKQALNLRPTLYFWGVYAALRDKEVEGFYLMHQEADLDEDYFMDEPISFIGVFDESSGLFV